MDDGSEAWQDERPYQARLGHPSMHCTLKHPGHDVRSESAMCRKSWVLSRVAMRPLHRVSYGSAQLPETTPKCLLPLPASGRVG